MADFIWEPTPEYIDNANVTRLMGKLGIDDYWELVRRSQEDIEWFWAAVIDDLGIEFFEPYDQMLDLSQGSQWPKWFVGGSINLTYNCVDRHAQRTPEAPAVIWEGEEGGTRVLSYAELSREVDRIANGLLALGVRRGDPVAVYMPMVPEAVAAMYGIAKIGAIYMPIFSGFGAPAIQVRLKDAQAKVLLTADGFYRRGSVVNMKAVADEAATHSPSLRHVVVYRRLGDDDYPVSDMDLCWEDAFGSQPDALEAPHLDPETPYMIAYTSGTTGKPKGSVHVHGGFLVKIAEEVAYQLDARPGRLIYWVSDMGWIMGPLQMVGGHCAGAAVFMYEGAPNYPDAARLWQMVERHRVNVLGISPTLVRALMPAGEEPIRKHDLSSLHILGSTGEPWNPEPYVWFSRVVGGHKIPIINLSGGTEIGACFLGQCPVVPTKVCSLGSPSLGMSVDVLGDDGRPVRGEVGELVCTKPWPAQTRGFWRAPQRYLDTYWSRWPDVWVHGDWASIDEDGYWYLHGRSDDTLNIAGKRIGPAEFESAAVEHPLVMEAAAVGVPHEVKGTAVWLFCILKPGAEGSGDLAAQVTTVVSDQLGKAFAPSQVRFVQELPKTRSAKILRRAIRAKVVGEDPGDISSLENPGALEAIEKSLR